MRLLLDTHVMLWHLAGTHRFGKRAENAIVGAEELAFSVVSFAEIGIKGAVGKLTVPPGLNERILATGVRVLGLSAEHGLAVADLPVHHRDPFDRLLIAQARQDGFTLLTADARIPLYEVRTLDPLS